MTHPSLFDVPRARHSDPLSAHEAAHAVAPAVLRLNEAILYAARLLGPATAFELAFHVQTVHEGRWDEGTIRTRVSALGKQGRLVKADGAGKSPRGQKCDRWFVPQRLRSLEDVPTGSRL